MGRSTIPVNDLKRNNSDGAIQSIAVDSGDGSRLVVLHGDVNESSVSLVVGQMLHLASINRKPIHLVISTYGGSVDEMFTLYDTIKFVPCRKNDGCVISADPYNVNLVRNYQDGDWY